MCLSICPAQLTSLDGAVVFVDCDGVFVHTPTLDGNKIVFKPPVITGPPPTAVVPKRDLASEKWIEQLASDFTEFGMFVVWFLACLAHELVRRQRRLGQPRESQGLRCHWSTYVLVLVFDEISPFCGADFVLDSPRLPTRFFWNDTDKVLLGSVHFTIDAEGPPSALALCWLVAQARCSGFAHGGAVATVFDDILAYVVWASGHPGCLTAYLRITMKKPCVQPCFMFDVLA